MRISHLFVVPNFIFLHAVNDCTGITLTFTPLAPMGTFQTLTQVIHDHTGFPKTLNYLFTAQKDLDKHFWGTSPFSLALDTTRS